MLNKCRFNIVLKNYKRDSCSSLPSIAHIGKNTPLKDIL
jgi:hypothetical protein